ARQRGRHLVGDALQEVAHLQLAHAAERGGEAARRDLVGGQARRALRRAAMDVSHGATSMRSRRTIVLAWFAAPEDRYDTQAARTGMAAPPAARSAVSAWSRV